MWYSALILALFALSAGPAQAGEWIDLFDGKSLEEWTLLPRKDQSGAWVIEEGLLKPEGKPGNLASAAEFGDFELLVEWKIAAQGNSGVFYRVPPGDETTSVAVEYQFADNERKASQDFPDRRNGAAYGLYPPLEDASRPIGAWNETRVVARGPHVEHWLNGKKVAEFEVGSEDWKRRAAASKFENPMFGTAPKGRIVLQDHASAVWFRAVKIRPL